VKTKGFGITGLSVAGVMTLGLTGCGSETKVAKCQPRNAEMLINKAEAKLHSQGKPYSTSSKVLNKLVPGAGDAALYCHAKLSIGTGAVQLADKNGN
jgi:hypothetical protein